MAFIPLALAARAGANYFTRRPYCASFELTHNCNARCRHCHRGPLVPDEKLASPERLLALCRELRPLVAIMSGGEPLLRRDLATIVRTLKQGCAPLRVFLNTNAALLTRPRFDELVAAGVDEVLISFDYPDERHDRYRAIPGLYGRIRALISGLDNVERRRIVLTTVLQSDNFFEAEEMARRAREWGVNINYSAYTWLRTNDRSLMIPAEALDAFADTIERLIRFKHTRATILTSDWVLRGMVRFFAAGGSLPNCRAGERSLVVNPDGTLSPCGLRVRDYPTHAALKSGFTASNGCGDCYTSTRGNSERPARYLFLDHLPYLYRRAGH
jgi:MoaA/NifB/PqqE/SkfB family radical SAM enzyme